MDSKKESDQKLSNRVKSQQTKSAKRSLLEDLFNDYYDRRYEIYRLNFVRGILFGFGSAIGGTVVLALIIWILSQLFGPSVSQWIDQFKQQ